MKDKKFPSREERALYAKQYYGAHCDKMDIIGITGTNGKTTTAHIVQHILNECGAKCGIIGTLGAVVDNETIHMDLTTPDPFDLHKIMASFHERGCSAVVMEVSAHAIDQKRTQGINFCAGIFTNLSLDHLDYFKDYRKYVDTKINWFDDRWMKAAIVNVDDIESKNIKHSNIISYSRDMGNYSTPLQGDFNKYNTMAAVKTALELGYSGDKIREALGTLKPIPGRFNTMEVNGATVIIDYAHTPDGLQNILTTASEIKKGKLISVFGCGGNRDATKRPKMGEISARLADFTVITSDNPRFEGPYTIMMQIQDGLKNSKAKHILIQDRELAIRYALIISRPGDVVVIAGKGAENYMEIGGTKIPFSDANIVEKYAQTRRSEDECKR